MASFSPKKNENAEAYSKQLHCKSALNDPEFNFDCPSLYYELTANTKSDENDDINPWFLIHHTNHDFIESSQSEIEKTEHSRLSNSTSGASKSTSSSMGTGPARSSKRQSTTSNGSTSTQSSFQPTNRRVSQRIDESKIEDRNLLKSKNASSSVSTLAAKRKSSNGSNPEDVDHVNMAGGSTDMRDKLSEYRLKRQKENNSSEDSITNNVVPTTDYSRSKIVRTEMTTQGPFTSKVGSSTTSKSQLAPPKTSVANRTITVNKDVGNSTMKSKNVTTAKPAIPNTKRPAASSSSSSSSSCSSSKSNAAPNSKLQNKNKNDDNETDKSMMELLKKHNQKFAPVPAYEPPRHSVRDVRKWEKLNGKSWSNLKPEEREVVNAEIGKMKELNQL
jgi:hypothetical protein